MSKEIIAELAELASQVEQHLKFYGEIGVTDIGGSGVRSPGFAETESDIAAFESSAEEPTQSSVLPQPFASGPAPATAGGGQSTLFGESPVRPSHPASSSVLTVSDRRDPSLEAIRLDIGDCVRCKLHLARTNIVFGEGNPQAKLVFVGEGPGADEDASGRPFVGRAGQLLDKIIEAINLRREDVYICNVVKCRPPGNRTPERDEVATCEPFLFRQLTFIQPKVIVSLGLAAFQCLLRTKESMSRSRGQWREWNGIRLMPTFHPAYLLRSPDKKRETWEDMKKVRDYLATLSD